MMPLVSVGLREYFHEAQAHKGYARIWHEGQSTFSAIRGNRYIQSKFEYNDLGQISQIDPKEQLDRLTVSS